MNRSRWLMKECSPTDEPDPSERILGMHILNSHMEGEYKRSTRPTQIWGGLEWSHLSRELPNRNYYCKNLLNTPILGAKSKLPFE